MRERDKHTKTQDKDIQTNTLCNSRDMATQKKREAEKDGDRQKNN